MTDQTKVARDLTEILRLYADLHDQAEARAASKLMPGGAAMAALGPVANLEAWGHMQETTERTGRPYTSVEDEDPDEAWSAYQLLEFWSEAWRRELGAEYDGYRTTIATEAAFIRAALDWAWSNEPHFDDFAADVNRARVQLENVLHAGIRHERSRIECDRCERAVCLVVFRGVADDGSDDVYKCPACKAKFSPEDAQRAHAKMLRSEGAERWIHQTDAISLLTTMGRSDRTVRSWLADGEGEGYCDPVTHQVWVWWPSLWRRHLTTQTRRRGEQAS